MSNPHKNISRRTCSLLDVVFIRWVKEEQRSQETLADALAISPSKLSTLIAGQFTDLDLAKKLGTEGWIRCVFLWGQIRNGFPRLDGFPKEMREAERVGFLADAVELLLSESAKL